MTHEEAAWLAGFVDGEGYVGVTTNGSLCLTISNTHRPTLEGISARHGGSVKPKSVFRRPRKNCRPAYVYGIYGDAARALLQLIRPWLREKGPQADLVLSWPTCGTGGRLTDDQFTQRAAIRRRLKELRHTPS